MCDPVSGQKSRALPTLTVVAWSALTGSILLVLVYFELVRKENAESENPINL